MWLLGGWAEQEFLQHEITSPPPFPFSKKNGLPCLSHFILDIWYSSLKQACFSFGYKENGGRNEKIKATFKGNKWQPKIDCRGVFPKACCRTTHPVCSSTTCCSTMWISSYKNDKCLGGWLCLCKTGWLSFLQNAVTKSASNVEFCNVHVLIVKYVRMLLKPKHTFHISYVSYSLKVVLYSFMLCLHLTATHHIRPDVGFSIHGDMTSVNTFGMSSILYFQWRMLICVNITLLHMHVIFQYVVFWFFF